MGQNFGVITTISEGEIALKELFQDGAGDWVERQSKMMLQEREQKK
ncbi:MAG: pilus assembly protein PilP, partial [Burkholderiales bacterium]